MSEDDVGFLYKTMIERDPNKRRVKPVETAHASLLDFDLGESSDDSDFRIEDHCDESDDDSVDSNDAGKDDDDDDDDEEDESSDSDVSLKESNKKNGKSAAFADLIQTANEQNLQGINLGEKLSKMIICCGCLGDRTDDVNEIVECDGCGITVHEGCYGISDVDSFSSADSLSQSAPWFCEACSAGVEDPDCELCPNKGGIFKETDAGKWVHLVCALYVPGVAFGEVDRLSSVTLFEMPYSKWGGKTCSLCEDLRYAVTGVCIECDAGMCHTYFHVTCAQKEGLLSETHSEEVDQADPFYAHCKLHSDKTLVKKRRKNWLTLQLRAKYRLELLKQPEYKNTDEYKRIQRKLSKHRQKYLLHKASKPPPWVPTQKMPRLLNTSASAVRNLKKKAELMGIDTEVEEAQEAQIASLIDIRKKWHISPAFSVEFVSYCIDRISRAASMKSKLEEFLQSNKHLLEEQQELDKKYDEVMKNNEDQMQIFNTHKEQIAIYHQVLQALSYSKPLPSIDELAKPKTPLPIQTSTPSIIALKKGISAIQASKDQNHVNNNQIQDQNHIVGVTIRHQCGICRRSNEQHLLAKCDTCHLHYHLSCLTPPLTRMPKKTKLFGWQCSECDKESSSSEVEQIDTSAPRRLRHCKEEIILSNSIIEEAPINKPLNSIGSLKKLPVTQSNHENSFINSVQHMPKVTIKPIVPDILETDEKNYNQHLFSDSNLLFRTDSPEYRMASPDVPITGRSGKKRRREKHKRYTPDPITGVKQRKHKHKRKSLDVENAQTNGGAPEVHRRITIKIKPIPLPDGKQPSETSPQLFVASSSTTDITPPKEYKKLKTVPKLLLPSPPSIQTAIGPVITDNGIPPIMNTPLSSSIINNKLPTINKKTKIEATTDCTVCNSNGTSQNLVMCDECKKGYHFTCLDPPVKKSPKRRGYSWHCADCDPTDLEN